MLMATNSIKLLCSGKTKEVFLFQKTFDKEKLHGCK